MKQKLIQFLLPLILLFACLGLAACGDELPERLSAPENVRVEGHELIWDSVEYADGYSLLIEQKEYETAENRYDLSWLDETGIYPIELMAYSNGRISNSEVVNFEFAGRFSRPTKGLEYEFLSNGTLRVSKLAVDDNGVCVIPATYSGYKVTSFITSTLEGTMTNPTPIPHEACPNIKTLYVPYAAANVSGLTYRYLTNLEEIVVGKDLEKRETRYVSEGNCIIDKQNNSVMIGTLNSVIPDYVTKIGRNAFLGRNLTSFTVPDHITEIGTSAFEECTLMTEFHLPKNFTAKKYDFLIACASLTEVTIPEGVVNLDEAFVKCSSLKEVHIPESVQSLWGTFRACTALERCAVPQNITSLDVTFNNCSSLKTIVLPQKMNLIEKNTFFGCPLEEVFYHGTEEEWNAINISATGNDTLLSAVRYYYSENPPVTSGNFWHYENGVPTKWIV